MAARAAASIMPGKCHNHMTNNVNNHNSSNTSDRHIITNTTANDNVNSIT